MNIQTGRVARPQKVVIYAPEGLGKSTLASLMPHPLFFDFEQGTHHMDVARVEPKTLEDFYMALRELIKSPNGFKTLIVDTIDWLEELVIKAVCDEAKKPGIEDFGYGKGYTYLAEQFTTLLTRLDRTSQATGMHIVLLAHSQVKKFDAPEQAGSYDRYELKLHKNISPLLKEWADALVFGNWKTTLADKEKEGKKNKAHGGKERIAYCNHQPAWDAKNRHGLKDEEPWDMKTIGKILAFAGQSPTEAAAARKAKQGAAVPDETITPPSPAAVGSPEEQGEPPLNKAQQEQADHKPTPKDEIPMGDAWRGDFLRIVSPHKDAVMAFLIGRQVITDSQGLEDVPEAYAQRVLKNPAQFLKAVNTQPVASA